MAKRAPPTADAIRSFNEVCTMRIELLESEPLIWRVLEVPSSMTLLALHETIQAAMGWFDCHLWEFVAGERHYAPRLEGGWDDPPRADAGITRLRDLLGRGIGEVLYIYDFGDSWEHRLIFSDVRQGEPGLGYPRFVAGARAGPPEDCGGIPGLDHILKVLADPGHPDHEEVADWLDEYDPEDIDQFRLEITLGRIASRRNGPAKRLAKPK